MNDNPSDAPKEQSTGQPPLNPVIPPTPVSDNKTLSIVGLILSFFTGTIGVIISVIAFMQSKKAGRKNGIALAGIIVGSVITVAAIISLILVSAWLASPQGKAFEKCLATDRGSVVVEGKLYSCETLDAISSLVTDDSVKDEDGNSVESVNGTPVSLSGSTVDSACWTFEMPQGYILSPNSVSCQTEIRQESGTSTGVAATSISIRSQVGDSSVDNFVDRVKATGAKVLKEERLTVAGNQAAKVVSENSLGISTDIYFIPHTGNLYSSTGKVTSTLISGPSASDSIISAILDSFSMK